MKKIMFLIIGCLIVLFLSVVSGKAQTVETRDFYEQYATSTGGAVLTETGFGSVHTFTYSSAQGNPAGSLQSTCTNTSGGCNSGGIITLTGTWQSLFGIPATGNVTEIVSASFDHIENGLGNRTYGTGDAFIENATGTNCQTWCIQINGFQTYGSTSWQTVGFNQVPNTDMELYWPQYSVGTTPIRLVIPVSSAVSALMVGGTATQRWDNLRMQIKYTMPQSQYLIPWLPSAQAATCTFTTTGATTTSECTDPVIAVPSIDYTFGLFLFFIMFFGLIFYFRKGVK